MGLQGTSPGVGEASQPSPFFDRLSFGKESRVPSLTERNALSILRRGRSGGGGRIRRRLTFCGVHRRRESPGACAAHRRHARERTRREQPEDADVRSGMATGRLVAIATGAAIGVAGVRMAAELRRMAGPNRGGPLDVKARPSAPVRAVTHRRVPVRIRFRRRVGVGFGGRVFRATTFRRRPFAP